MRTSSLLTVSAIVAAIATQTGCYIFYPRDLPDPRDKGIMVMEGEPIVIRSKTYRVAGTCTDARAKDGECELRGHEWVHYSDQTESWAEYSGRRLRRIEFYQLADPTYAQRLQGIRDQKGTCSVSLIPTVLSAAAFIGGFALPLFASNRFSDNETTYIFVGGLVGGTVLGAASYPLGGFACVRASNIANAAFDGANDTVWKYGAPDEVKALAAAFNARVNAPPRTSESTPVAADPAVAGVAPAAKPPRTNETAASNDSECVQRYLTKAWGGRRDAEAACAKYSPATFERAERIIDAGATDGMHDVLSRLDRGTPAQIDRAEALLRAGMGTLFFVLLDDVKRYAEADLECAEKAFGVELKTKKHPKFDPHACWKKRQP